MCVCVQSNDKLFTDHAILLRNKDLIKVVMCIPDHLKKETFWEYSIFFFFSVEKLWFKVKGKDELVISSGVLLYYAIFNLLTEK